MTFGLGGAGLGLGFGNGTDSEKMLVRNAREESLQEMERED